MPRVGFTCTVEHRCPLLKAAQEQTAREIFVKLDKIIGYRPDAPYKTTIEWDEYQALKSRYLPVLPKKEVSHG